MNVSIEWHECGEGGKRLGIARVHGDGGYGTPWTFGCVIKDEGKHCAYIELAQRSPTFPELRALRAELTRQGFTQAQWERRNVLHPRTVRHG